MSKDKQLENDAEIEALASETEVSSDASVSESNNRRAFMTGALAATAGVVAASALGSKKAEANPMATSMSMAAGSANFSFTYSTTEWGIQDVSSSNWYVHGSQEAETSLYYNGSEKLKTTVDGIEVSGEIVSTGPATVALAGEGHLSGETTSGAFIHGKGSSYDVVLAIANGVQALRIPTGTTNVEMLGDLAVTGNSTFLGDVIIPSNIWVNSAGTKGIKDCSGGKLGTIQTAGTAGTSSWEGYSIEGNYTFMGLGAIRCGIYDNANLKWMMECHSNASVDLYYNGVEKLKTTNEGIQVTSTVAFDGTRKITKWDDAVWQGLKVTSNRNTDCGFGLFNSVGGHCGTLYASSSSKEIGFLTLSHIWSLKHNTTTGVTECTDFTATSDERLKTKVGSITHPEALEFIRQLKPLTHTWKGENKPEGIFDAYMAQDIQVLRPSLVHKSSDGFLSLNYSKMIVMTNTAVSANDERISRLETENTALVARLEKLEKLLG